MMPFKPHTEEQRSKIFKKLLNDQKTNKLFAPNTRLNILPIKYKSIHNAYKDHLKKFWKVDDLKIAKDKPNFQKMSKDVQNVIKKILSFFAGADKQVDENIGLFISQVKIPEVLMFYSFQSTMEGIHQEVYGRLIQALVDDPNERKKLLEEGPIHSKTIKNKLAFCAKWMNVKLPYVTRLIAFAAIEGIFFSSSFAFFHWVCTLKNSLMQGFKTSNEFISRDEGLHVSFAVLLYWSFFKSVDPKIIFEIINDAMIVECAFVDEILPNNLTGMNARIMKNHVKHTANNLLKALGVNKYYYLDEQNSKITKSPFGFMVKSKLDQKFNFFETTAVYTDDEAKLTIDNILDVLDFDNF